MSLPEASAALQVIQLWSNENVSYPSTIDPARVWSLHLKFIELLILTMVRVSGLVDTWR